MARLWIISLSTCLLVFAAPVQGLTLVYEAYIEGVNVGVARIHIASNNGEYWIRGKAKTSGLLDSFTGWRSFFRANGLLERTGPTVLAYRRTDSGSGKDMDILYAAGGVTRYNRNGKPRPPFTPPASMDLLSTVFMLPDCHRLQHLHDGKDLWRLATAPDNGDQLSDVAGAIELCHLKVVDEDEAESTLSLWIGELDEFAVPLRLQFRGDLSGVLELVR